MSVICIIHYAHRVLHMCNYTPLTRAYTYVDICVCAGRDLRAPRREEPGHPGGWPGRLPVVRDTLHAACARGAAAPAVQCCISLPRLSVNICDFTFPKPRLLEAALHKRLTACCVYDLL